MIAVLLLYPLAVIPVVILCKTRLVNILALLSYAVLLAGISVALYVTPAQFTSFFGVDSLNILFLLVLALLMLAVSVYNAGYLWHSTASAARQAEYTVFFLLFVGSMVGVILSQHLAFYWVFLEATTLSSAPLIYFERTNSSLEAAWKYIFICSIGIALAFVGIILISLGAGQTGSLFFVDLYKNAGSLVPLWLKLSFPFILVGLGTKMGLAPVHAWLPDAHSESPSPVSAMLSGTLLNMALLGILRVFKLMHLAQLDYYAANLLLVMGFLSLLISAVFILRTDNYKRMLAYSSIENMGIIAIGAGIGGIAIYAALLHVVVHSLTKGAFFLTAGNVLHFYKTKETGKIQGILKTLPIDGWLWIACFVAISGIPPFPSFTSEFLLVKGMFSKGFYWQSGIFFLLLTFILYGMGRSVLQMSFGENNDDRGSHLGKTTRANYLPPLVLLLLLLVLGIYMPGPVHSLLEHAAQELSIF
ncbi:MAG TPA: proton-conducting transporter membrane subunit [Candidatus Deferrimicrobium sp.]|nr:proton-conducting transporter membrane subunit [Candidatus Deferrimicrobium sp.]